MTTPNSTPAATPAPAKPMHGVDICDCCGHPPKVVGPLTTEGDFKGYCSYCAHQIARYEIVEDELVELIRDWYRACLDRGLTANEIDDTLDAAAARLKIWADGHPKSTAA